jgi:hypothetical protein
MPRQSFPPIANTIARLSIVALGLLVIVVAVFLLLRMHSPLTKAPVGIPIEQPVRFSHQLHASQLNLDCRYCHSQVQTTAFAGIPDTYTCMTCHSQVALDSELLQPVRDSYTNTTRIEWKAVHSLAQHVYFNHSIHVNKGVGCETCHGRVDQMPIVWRQEVMTMRWCLDCHQAPEKYIRPLEAVYQFGYTSAEDQVTLGSKLVQEYHIDVNGLTDCAVCHR